MKTIARWGTNPDGFQSAKKKNRLRTDILGQYIVNGTENDSGSTGNCLYVLG